MGIGQRDADRADLLDAVDGVAGHQTGGLGQAVALGDLNAGCGLEPGVKLDRQGGRAGNRHAQRRDIAIQLALHQRGDGGWHGDQETGLPALDQLPEIVQHPLAAIAGGGRHHQLRPRGKAGHQHRIGGKDVEHWQRAHQHVLFGEQYRLAQPAVVDHARLLVLRDLGCAGGAAGVEIGRDAVVLGLVEGQAVVALPAGRRFEVQIFRLITDLDLGTQQGDRQPLQPRQIGPQIDLEDGLDRRGQSHRRGSLLRDIGFRERLQRHQNLGPGLAQDAGDVFGVKQRVDRVDDARRRARQQNHGRLDAIGQQIGHHVLRADAEIAQQVGGFRHPLMQLVPGQCDGFRPRVGKKLEADCGAVGEFLARASQHPVDRGRAFALRIGHLCLDRSEVRRACKLGHHHPPRSRRAPPRQQAG